VCLYSLGFPYSLFLTFSSHFPSMHYCATFFCIGIFDFTDQTFCYILYNSFVNDVASIPRTPGAPSPRPYSGPPLFPTSQSWYWLNPGCTYKKYLRFASKKLLIVVTRFDGPFRYSSMPNHVIVVHYLQKPKTQKHTVKIIAALPVGSKQYSDKAV